AADLGAQSADGGFLPLAELGFGVTSRPVDPGTVQAGSRRLAVLGPGGRRGGGRAGGARGPLPGTRAPPAHVGRRGGPAAPWPELVGGGRGDGGLPGRARGGRLRRAVR